MNTDGLNNRVTSPIKSNDMINMQETESGIKPVELDDFFEFLDTKTVQKIKETSADSKSRIMNDIAQIEYETNGAKAILDSLA